MVASHRLVVRGTHHHAHGISRLQVLWVVGIEGPSPHGRPQVVALQAQDELKYLLIELMPSEIGAKGILYPCRKTGGLVVEEQSAIPDGRLAIGIFALLNI